MTIPTREIVLTAKDIVGIVRRYGTEDLSSINVLLDHDTAFTFDCEEKKWHPWNGDSYWDLYESEYMLTGECWQEPSPYSEVYGNNPL